MPHRPPYMDRILHPVGSCRSFEALCLPCPCEDLSARPQGASRGDVEGPGASGVEAGSCCVGCQCRRTVIGTVSITSLRVWSVGFLYKSVVGNYFCPNPLAQEGFTPVSPGKMFLETPVGHSKSQLRTIELE